MKERILTIVYNANNSALRHSLYRHILIHKVNYNQGGRNYARTVSENQNCTRQTGAYNQPDYDKYRQVCRSPKGKVSAFGLLENGLGEAED